MKYIIAFIVSIAMFATNAYAAPEEFVGIFKGTEKTTVTNCGAYNGVTTSSWSAKHSEIKGTTLQGTGSNDNGDFAITGEVTDNVVSGTIQGVNKWHQAWKGEFSAKLDGDKYSSTATGSVSTGCKFASEIEALRK